MEKSRFRLRLSSSDDEWETTLFINYFFLFLELCYKRHGRSVITLMMMEGYKVLYNCCSYKEEGVPEIREKQETGAFRGSFVLLSPACPPLRADTTESIFPSRRSIAQPEANRNNVRDITYIGEHRVARTVSWYSLPLLQLF